MLNTIKSFKWFFTIAAISVLLGIFTFIAFLNQGLFFLNEQDLQFLLFLASLAIEKLRASGVEITETEQLCVEIGGLCHDLGKSTHCIDCILLLQ